MRGLGTTVRSLASLAVALGLVVGIPLALILAVGWPGPSEVPSWAEVSDALQQQDISTDVLVKSLTVVVWAAWVPLAWAIVVETFAAARGRTAGHVMTWPGAQRLARKLVASAALLLTSLGGMKTAGASPLDPGMIAGAEVAADEALPGEVHDELDGSEPDDLAGVVVDLSGLDGVDGPGPEAGSGAGVDPAGDQWQQSEWQAGARMDGAGLGGGGSLATAVRAPESDIDTRTEAVHRVEQGDTFWGLADEYLGSGLRWREIRDHNIGRPVSPDHVLTASEDSLRAGWEIAVPPDDAVAAYIAPAALRTAPDRASADRAGPAAVADPEAAAHAAEGEATFARNVQVGDEATPVTVAPGDHFWALAERQLQEAWGREVTAEEVGPYWQELVTRNVDQLSSSNPDIVFPGEQFIAPPPPADPAPGSQPALDPSELGPRGDTAEDGEEISVGEAEAEADANGSTTPDEGTATSGNGSTATEDTAARTEEGSTAADDAPTEEASADEAAPTEDAAVDDGAGESEADATDSDEAAAGSESEASEGAEVAAGADGDGEAAAADSSSEDPDETDDEAADDGTALGDDGTEDEGAEDGDGSSLLSVAVPLGASAVLAGLLLVALRRRRFSRRRLLKPGQRIEPRQRDHADLERGMAVGAQDIYPTVAAASRGYGAALASNPDLPAVSGMWVSPSRDVTLQLAGPARPEVPFERGPESERWDLYLDELDLDPNLGPGPEPAASVLDTPAVIGRDDDGDWVVIDLESVGALEIDGDERVASNLVRSIVAELALQPQAERMVDLTVVGVDGLAPDLLEQGVVAFDRLDEDLVRRVERVAAETDSMQAHRGAAARAKGLPRDGLFVTVVALGGWAAPDPTLLERLTASAVPGGRGIAVVAVGPLGTGATRVLVDGNGEARVPHMGATVEAVQLAASDLQMVERMLADEPEQYEQEPQEAMPESWPEWPEAWGEDTSSVPGGWMGAWLPGQDSSADEGEGVEEAELSADADSQDRREGPDHLDSLEEEEEEEPAVLNGPAAEVAAPGPPPASHAPDLSPPDIAPVDMEDLDLTDPGTPPVLDGNGLRAVPPLEPDEDKDDEDVEGAPEETAYEPAEQPSGPVPIDVDQEVGDRGGTAAPVADQGEPGELNVSEEAQWPDPALLTIASPPGGGGAATAVATATEEPAGERFRGGVEEVDLREGIDDGGMAPPYEPPAWELCIRVFADHLVESVDGEHVSFRYGQNPDVPNKNTHRGPELLAYLALCGRAASAEEVRDHLWWDRPVALGTVNKLVYGTRKVVGGAEVLSHAQEDPLGRYRLISTVVTDAQLLVDALEYARTVANRHPDAAVDMLRPHLAAIETVAFRNGHLGQGLMEWASAFRVIDSVELPVIEAALLYARLSCEQGRPGYHEALWGIDQGLRACPYNEALVRVAMEIEALLGNSDAVNHRYLTLATRLARDELEPEPETSELRTRLGGATRLRSAG